MPVDAAKIAAQLRELQRNYIAGLPGRLDEIEHHWRCLDGGAWDAARLAELHRRVHSLTGSGQTFGLAGLSDRARVIEHEIHGLIQTGLRPDKVAAGHLARLLSGLRETLADAANIKELTPGVLPSAYPGEASANHAVYLFEDDADLAHELTVHLGQFGYRLRTFAGIEDIGRAIAEEVPGAVIVDIMTDQGPMHGFSVAEKIRGIAGHDVPVIFMSARDDFEARLAAVRCGGNAYVVKPVDVPSLVDRLDGLTRPDEEEPYRILIVDDDEVLAARYALVLNSAGLVAATVTRPEHVVEELVQSGADLIIMDLYMPGCTGYELARVIRQQDVFLGIPIIFLSTETDIDNQLAAMRVGGDDFLTKPIDDERLIATVQMRAERARVLGGLMMYDSLTGLLKHARILEALAVEVTRADRRDALLSYAMIDIDHFKTINDTGGHMLGDRVIKSLARLLKRRLRQGDSIGRYGGEEFAVVMTDCDEVTAHAILDEIRESFAAVTFSQGGRNFSATFSAGIAGFPVYRDAGALCRAADAALYRAKHQGRNRIVMDGDTPA